MILIHNQNLSVTIYCLYLNSYETILPLRTHLGCVFLCLPTKSTILLRFSSPSLASDLWKFLSLSYVKQPIKTKIFVISNFMTLQILKIILKDADSVVFLMYLICQNIGIDYFNNFFISTWQICTSLFDNPFLTSNTWNLFSILKKKIE